MPRDTVDLPFVILPEEPLVFDEMGSPAAAGPLLPAAEPVPATADELMSKPDCLLAWLQSKPADEVVVSDIGDPCSCLAATFLKESGFEDSIWGVAFGYVDCTRVDAKWIGEPIRTLISRGESFTAAEVLDVVASSLRTAGV